MMMMMTMMRMLLLLLLMMNLDCLGLGFFVALELRTLCVCV